MGTVGCFSLLPSKNLGCFGDGGMVTTNDRALAEKLKIFRNQGAQPKYYYKVVGGNFRLDAIQAAVLRVKLKHLDSWTEGRRANASYYTRRLEELGLAGDLIVPPPVVHERHIYNQYVIRAQNRDALRAYLQDKGVATEVYYPKALHLQECVRKDLFKEGDFPITEEATASVLALPIYPELTALQKDYVVSKIEEFYSTEESTAKTPRNKGSQS